MIEVSEGALTKLRKLIRYWTAFPRSAQLAQLTKTRGDLRTALYKLTRRMPSQRRFADVKTLLVSCRQLISALPAPSSTSRLAEELAEPTL